MSNFKQQQIRLPKILKGARGAPCMMNSQVCNKDPETTVACHLNYGWAGKGMSQKAGDHAVFYACSECHRYYDESGGHFPDWALLKAVVRTYEYLFQRGVIK